MSPETRFAAGLLAIAFVVSVALPDHRGDGTYYTAARLMLQGKAGPRFYDDEWMGAQIQTVTLGRVDDIFRPNPPTAALLALPVAWLPPDRARHTWAAINLTVLLASLAYLLRANRRTLASTSNAPAAGTLQAEAPWLAALAFGLFAAPVVEGFQLGQAYILLLGLYTLASRALLNGSEGVTGASLSAALMLKASGAPAWLLLAVRRQWRALLWGGAAALVLFVASLPWLGLDMWRVYLTEVLPAAARAPSIGATAFQSLPGFWTHLFRFDPQWSPAPLADWPWLASVLSLASVAAVIGLTLLHTHRAPLPLAFAAIVAAGIFVVPPAEQHHYTLAVLPAFVAAGQWARRPAAREIGLALCAALLLIGLPLPYEAPLLARGALALLAYPRLYGGLILWGLLLNLARRAAVAPRRTA